jgi:signal transduction histidine kinase
MSATPTPDLRRPHFRVSPAVLGPLGAEQLQDSALAVLELIKNSWDADAKRVKVVIDQRSSNATIRVSDTGHGMTAMEFGERWLVIGASSKRDMQSSEGGRPLIGEKGLGRLASFALGNSLTIRSARESGKGFAANVNWVVLSAARSLEDYTIHVRDCAVPRGTTVLIGELKGPWTDRHTEFLESHAQFLTSVPGERFRISLEVDGTVHLIADSSSTIDRLVEGTLAMEVDSDGRPRIVSCVIRATDESSIVFRDMKSPELDRRLAGMRLSLKFFLRDDAARKLSNVLNRNEVMAVLERYQGIRIFRDQINVPPYGLNGDDWAGLEKQRTATGGPTLVPGNSQLIGEVHLSRQTHSQFVITAGRSGFSDQAAVVSLARYVRWAVKALGTARRAYALGITGRERIPARVDEEKKNAVRNRRSPKAALSSLARDPSVRSDPNLRQKVDEASVIVEETLAENEQTLRLYAQLASTGIAATSFAHELRAEFDVVTEAVSELTTSKRRPDKELVELLTASWRRIRAFAGLFKVIPVKTRRQKSVVSAGALKRSAQAILALATPDKIATKLVIPSISVNVVPAELDSVMLNLVSNAIKAIAESSQRESGKIRVAYESNGADLLLRVADNGCGAPPEVRQIMFEPLEGRFSEGTGMGLPIVRYIAERYGGSAQVQNVAPNGYSTEIAVTFRNVIR